MGRGWRGHAVLLCVALLPPASAALPHAGARAVRNRDRRTETPYGLGSTRPALLSTQGAAASPASARLAPDHEAAANLTSWVAEPPPPPAPDGEREISRQQKRRDHTELLVTWAVMLMLGVGVYKMTQGESWTPRARAPYVASLLILTCITVFATLFYTVSAHYWTWLECLYFCVVTITTVGYGDFVPFDSMTDKVLLLVFLWFNALALSVVLSIVVDGEPPEAQPEVGPSPSQELLRANEVKRVVKMEKRLWYTSGCLLALIIFGAAIGMGMEGLSFSEGLFFATVTLSTVGYGHFTPKSSEASMIITLLFILFGVPAAGCFVHSLSGRIDKALEARKEAMSQGCLFATYAAFIIAWLLLGATCFHSFSSHDHTWLECFYLAAVTMTTVGYGDIVIAHTVMDRMMVIAFIWASVIIIAIVLQDMNEAILDSLTHSMSRNTSLLAQIGLLGVIMLVGVLAFDNLEGWSVVEGLVFTSVTCTTVGYGHLHPTHARGQIFAVPFMLFAVPLTNALICHVSKEYSAEINMLVDDSIPAIQRATQGVAQRLPKKLELFRRQHEQNENTLREWMGDGDSQGASSGRHAEKAV